MRKRTPWMLALMTAILVLCMAEKAACETFSYNGYPHQPFPDAWGDSDVDCADFHGVHETECWKCESLSPPVDIPKFTWEKIVECPTFVMRNTVQSNCYCVLAGDELTDSVSAGYEAEDGKKYYESSIEGCGGDPPEEEPITLGIEWSWSTAGLTTDPASGTDSTATFEYTVPEGPFSIDVSFSAKATPSDTNCNEITAGPEVVGKITGEGYEKRSILPINIIYPSPRYVTTPPTDGQGNTGWGSLTVTISNDLECESVCSSTDCEKWRINGCFNLDASMTILSCLSVTADDCNKQKGECRERTFIEKVQTEHHEQKHYDLWRTFIDEWNERIIMMRNCLTPAMEYKIILM